MINLYDTPAQAQFINTYVPIQFEGLYKLADRAREDIEKGTELMDKVSGIQSLGSMSDVDNKMWNEKVSQINKYVSDNVKDIYSLQDPTIKAGLNNMIRRFESDPGMKNALESKEMYKDMIKKADPRFKDSYLNKIRQHNSFTDGVFADRPLEWQEYTDVAGSLLKGVKPELLKKADYKDWYDEYGISERTVNDVIDANMQSILGNEALIARSGSEFKDAIKSGTLDPDLYQKDEAGNVIGVKEGADKEFLLRQVKSAGLQITKGRTRELNSQVSKMWDNAQEWARFNANKTSKESYDMASQIKLHARSSYISSMQGSLASNISSMKQSGLSDKAIINKVGTDAFNWYNKIVDIDTKSASISALQDSRDRALAAGNQEEARALSIQIDKESNDMKNMVASKDYLGRIVGRDLSVAAENSMSGRTGAMTLTPSQIANARRTTIPADIAATITSQNIGPEVSIKMGKDNLPIKAYIASTTRGLSVVNPATGLSDVTATYSRAKSPKAVSNLNSASNKLNSVLSSGILDGKSYVMPTGMIEATKYGVSTSNNIMIKKSDLENVLSPEEIRTMSANKLIKKHNIYSDELNPVGDKVTVANEYYIIETKSAPQLEESGDPQSYILNQEYKAK